MPLLALLLLVGLGATHSAAAQPAAAQQLGVRLVEARNATPATTDPGLEDVAPALRANLRYNSFALKTNRTFPLQNAQSLDLGMGYSMALTEVAGQKVTVTLSRGRQRLLQTTVILQPGKPLSLGGMPVGDNAALIVVLKLAN